MDNLFFIIIGIFSFLIFFKLLKVKASKKQINRSNRINWRLWEKKYPENQNIIDADYKEEQEAKNDKE
jgi:hypothetical protein|tara:strand:- start:496 stop:699 length:204 start_codon:yes stop_codon:yes gene_type:complete